MKITIANRFAKIAATTSAIALSLALFGCANMPSMNGSRTSDSNTTNADTVYVQDVDAQADSNDGANTVGIENYDAHTWSAEIAPEGYATYGPAIVSFSVAPGEYVYTGCDALGRTTTAYASITPADYWREKGEEREEFGRDADTISGWGHNEKVSVTFPNGRVYNGYFYNRSHLIADSLGGTPTPDNLVTGTRFQNVGCGAGGGMAYPEELAREWLENAPDGASLYYAVTPVYVGTELVPRSVYVDVKSSDGAIDKHIETFNVPGDIAGTYSVDYMTGQILASGTVMR